MTWDTVIVGAGPAGLYLAQLLARAGLSVRVLEEHAGIGEPVHCTGLLGTEALALPGVPTDVVLGAPSAAGFHSPGGDRVAYGAGKDEARVIDRAAFDRGLAERAAAAGAVVSTGAKVRALELTGDGVMASVEDDGGRPGAVTARVGVLATGAGYRLQRALGWGQPSMFLGSAQVELPAAPAVGLEVFLRPELVPSGFGWMVPLSRGGEPRVKVGVMARVGARRALGRLVAELTTAGLVHPRRAPVVTRLLPLGPLQRTYGARLLAVGDAAGLVKPTTGGGIYYSLLSARWAADTLGAAFAAGDFSSARMEAYERTWRAHLGPELRVGLWFRRLAAHLTAGDLDAMAALALQDGLLPVVRSAARFNWHRDVILRSLRHPGVVGIVTRRLALKAAEAGRLAMAGR